MEEKKDFKHLVRIANTDVDGNKPLYKGLTKIKGISFMFANAVVTAANIEKKQKIGYLTDIEVKKIDDIIKNPLKANIPFWMFNRKKDFETGKDIHITGANLDFIKDNDIKQMGRLQELRRRKGLAQEESKNGTTNKVF